MKQPDGLEPPIMEIRGFRGQTLAGWRQNLLGPAFCAIALATIQFSKNAATKLIFGGGLVVVVVVVVVRLMRGRIQLFADRIEVTAWNDTLPLVTKSVRFQEMRTVMLSGSTITIVRNAPGKRKRRTYRLSIAAPVAEELFDEMAKAFEQLPFKIEEKGEGKGSIRRTAE